MGAWRGAPLRCYTETEGDEWMSETVLVGVLSLAGTLVGSLMGVLTANRLTNYRIAQLEAKVDKHNHLVERMVVVEQSAKSAHHRLDGMERKVES